MSQADAVQRNRPEALRELSRRFGECWVALKGYQTCIGKSTGEISLNPSGNPFLAQGGAGDVLAGRMKPTDCPHFGAACTPDTPLGAPMVSSEGACAAYYRYRSRALETAGVTG